MRPSDGTDNRYLFMKECIVSDSRGEAQAWWDRTAGQLMASLCCEAQKKENYRKSRGLGQW